VDLAYIIIVNVTAAEKAKNESVPPSIGRQSILQLFCCYFLKFRFCELFFFDVTTHSEGDVILHTARPELRVRCPEKIDRQMAPQMSLFDAGHNVDLCGLYVF